MGSKNRLSKYIKPIIESFINNKTTQYIEPFVGGANIIDKIKFHNKLGMDINKYLISLLSYSQHNNLPETISEDTYNEVKNNKENYEDWFVGLVGFCGSFGAKWFGGFARRYNKDGSLFDVPRQAINSLRKQSSDDMFKNIQFTNGSYSDLDCIKIENAVIYCDPPYRDTTAYKDNEFNYNDFYKWCIDMSKKNTVLISEYYMPENYFKCIWSKEHYTSLGSGINKDYNNKKIEKLWIVKGDDK